MINPVFRLLAVPLLLIALAAIIAPAEGAESASMAADSVKTADSPGTIAPADGSGTSPTPDISDIYSSIESADVTALGDVAGMKLHMDLISEGTTLMSRELLLDGPGTWVVTWPKFEAEKGSYSVCARLETGSDEYGEDRHDGQDSGRNSVLARKCYKFYYGGVEPIRFDVRDFRADSRGMHLAISASDPTVVDIYYMLMQGSRAVYVNREQAAAIAGSYSMPIVRDYAWKQILEDGRPYAGRVKIVELNHNQTRAFMNSFTAEEDALITETYQDETGASATVLGNSRVPFAGSLRFVLTQNETVVNVTEKRTPILLSGDDETVEISWNETLPEGVYQLRTLLVDRRGGIMDLEENVIEAEPIVRANATDEAEKAPFPAEAAALAALLAALLRGRRDR